MFYNARWYDPYLNHFTQPDSIVPDPYNSQDFDRYAYARNNPLRYTDPSGHEPHGPGSCYDYVNGKCGGDASNRKMVFIACGWGNRCQNGNPDQLFTQLYNDLVSQGYSVSFFDVVGDASSPQSKENVGKTLAYLGKAYSGHEVHLIGYSAGGDSVNIAYGMTADPATGNSDAFASMVIIDSYLETSGDYDASVQDNILKNIIHNDPDDLLVIDPANGDGHDMSMNTSELTTFSNYKPDFLPGLPGGESGTGHLGIPYYAPLQIDIVKFIMR